MAQLITDAAMRRRRTNSTTMSDSAASAVIEPLRPLGISVWTAASHKEDGITYSPTSCSCCTKGSYNKRADNNACRVIPALGHGHFHVAEDLSIGGQKTSVLCVGCSLIPSSLGQGG